MKLLPEIWVAVPDFESTYEVSSYGRIRSIPRVVRQMSRNGNEYFRQMPSVILRGSITPGGYLSVALHRDGKMFPTAVHVTVARAFLGRRPDQMHVCHRDNVKLNNDLFNLRYDTAAGNAADKVLHGTLLWGDKCPSSKLRSHQVLEIRSRTGTHAALAREFGVDAETIAMVRAGRTWRKLLPAAEPRA